MSVLNHFTLLPIRAKRKMKGGGGGRVEGEERGGVNTHTHTYTRACDKGNKKEGKGKRGRETGERKGKNVNEPASVAPARARIGGVYSHGVAPRRQASSVARHAPLHSHVTLHLVARAHAVRVGLSRTFLSL